MSQLVSIESVLRPVISAAFKSLETKTYDTSREDYMDVLLEDLFQILFPHNATTTATPVATTTTVTTGAGQVIEKKKPGPKPRTKEHPPLPPSPVNIQKVDPKTLRKKLNDAAKKYKIKYTRDNDAEFLEWANRLTPEEFKELNDNDKLAEQYFVNQTSTTTVAAPSPPNPPQPPQKEEETETQLKEVFGDKGESYWVDTQTGRIYEGEGELDKETGAYSNYKPLGYVGEGPFKNIKV